MQDASSSYILHASYIYPASGIHMHLHTYIHTYTYVCKPVYGCSLYLWLCLHYASTHVLSKPVSMPCHATPCRLSRVSGQWSVSVCISVARRKDDCVSLPPPIHPSTLLSHLTYLTYLTTVYSQESCNLLPSTYSFFFPFPARMNTRILDCLITLPLV